MGNPARPWESAHEPTPERAARLISRQFPDVRADRLTMLGRGWDNTAFLTEAGIVFRFPRRAEAVVLLETEARVLPALAGRLPLAVPMPEWRGEPADDYPFPFLGHRALPGRPASAARLSDAERAAAAPVLGLFLSRLHELAPLPAGLPGDVLERGNFTKRIPVLIERLETLRARGLIADARPWLALFDVDAGGALPVRPALVHGDMYAHHLLVDGAHAVTGIIDWGDVHAGDPAMDLMVAFAFLPASARVRFFESYGVVSDDVLVRARLRAAFHAASVAWYGVESGDGDLVAEGRSALGYVLAE